MVADYECKDHFISVPQFSHNFAQSRITGEITFTVGNGRCAFIIVGIAHIHDVDCDLLVLDVSVRVNKAHCRCIELEFMPQL